MTTLFTIRSDLPCILVDTSYYVFYRFFDSWKKFRQTCDKLSISVPITESLCDIPYFLKQVYHDMNADFSEMLRAWRTVSSNLIFCKDCSRASIWRNDHTTQYKSNRPQKNLFNPEMFSLVSQYCKDRRFQEMAVAQLEADDLVALTKKQLRDAGFKSPIILITNDNDYLQLLDDQTHASGAPAWI
jgi:5'-3' exonuclease